MADILIKGLALPTDGSELVIKITRHRQIAKVYGNPSTRGSSWLIVHGARAIELPEHGDLIDRGLVQEVLAQLLPLVITNELTDKEIGLVHRTVGAIAEMINEQEVVVEATNE